MAKMKRMIFAVLPVLLLSGCGTAVKSETIDQQTPASEMIEEVKEQAAPAQKQEVTINIGAYAGFEGTSVNLEEAVANSDLIAEVRVKDVKPEVSYDDILSNFEPEIIEIYKGEYEGGGLRTMGGIMPFSEYEQLISGSERANLSGYTEEEKSGLVKYSCWGTPVLQEGDRVIIFADKDSENGGYRAHCYNESIFFCDDDTITLTPDTFAYGDLWNDLRDRFALEGRDTDEETVLDKAAFVAAIKN